MEEARTKMVWPPCTMNKPRRTLEVMQETSDAARDNPDINPQENFGQKGNYNGIQCFKIALIMDFSFLVSSWEQTTVHPRLQPSETAPYWQYALDWWRHMQASNWSHHQRPSNCWTCKVPGAHTGIQATTTGGRIWHQEALWSHKNSKRGNAREYNHIQPFYSSPSSVNQFPRQVRVVDYSGYTASEWRTLSQFLFLIPVIKFMDWSQQRDNATHLRLAKLWCRFGMIARAVQLPTREYQAVSQSKLKATIKLFYETWDTVFSNMNCRPNLHLVMGHFIVTSNSKRFTTFF